MFSSYHLDNGEQARASFQRKGLSVMVSDGGQQRLEEGGTADLALLSSLVTQGSTCAAMATLSIRTPCLV